MGIFDPIKPAARPRVGLYAIGHEQYWNQFEGLLDRLNGYTSFIERRLSAWAEVTHAGMIDNEAKSHRAGELFNEHNVDLIVCHAATYAMSASHLAIAQICKRPVIVLNLQPCTRMNYEKTTTGEWLAHCVACCVPEISNAFRLSLIHI